MAFLCLVGSSHGSCSLAPSLSSPLLRIHCNRTEPPSFRRRFLPPSIFSFRLSPPSLPTLHLRFPPPPPPFNDPFSSAGGGGHGNNGNSSGDGGRGWWWWCWGPNDGEGYSIIALLLLLLPLCLYCSLASARTAALTGVWEIRGSKRIHLAPDPSGSDSFIVVHEGTEETSTGVTGLVEYCRKRCSGLLLRLLLPEGYPHSVSSDYIDYTLWRGMQAIASQISGVLSTQALLYAVGLGKGVIPTAAAINWVLKDGIGYLSKILLSNFGRHFDVNPKGWRLFADLLENAAYGMEILTPAFPHLFVYIGAAAGAGRSAAALIQASTRSCFYAGFALQRNFAEVIAKGEAQGMVSKFIGIMLGISLANYVGSSTPLAIVAFGLVSGIHMYCNFESYKSIHLRTLNPFRACLVFSEYLLSGQIPLIKDVNDEEPLFTSLPLANVILNRLQSKVLSAEAKDAATQICRRLQLGSKLTEVIYNKEDASALFDLYRNEGYLLTECDGRYCVILKESSTPEDMLKSLFQINYLFWLERYLGSETRCTADGCRHGGRLWISLEYVRREFAHIKHDGSQHGWLMDGLIARPLPNRIDPVYAISGPTG